MVRVSRSFLTQIPSFCQETSLSTVRRVMTYLKWAFILDGIRCASLVRPYNLTGRRWRLSGRNVDAIVNGIWYIGLFMTQVTQMRQNGDQRIAVVAG